VYQSVSGFDLYIYFGTTLRVLHFVKYIIYTLVTFVVSFVSFWLFFSDIWYIIEVFLLFIHNFHSKPYFNNLFADETISPQKYTKLLWKSYHVN